MALLKPNEKSKATLYCVGTIGVFGDVAASKTEGSPYFMEKVEIRPSGEGEKASFRFMWAREFFEAGFDPSMLDNSSGFVYKKNIASLDGQSLLEGLCGSDDSWEAVQVALQAIENDATAENIHNAFASHFAEQGPVPFIYVLKQERKQDGFRTNDDGKEVKRYVNGKYYEVDEILHLTEKNVKSLVKRYEKNVAYAEKQASAGKPAPTEIRFKFDPSDFGLETVVPESAVPAWV